MLSDTLGSEIKKLLLVVSAYVIPFILLFFYLFYNAKSIIIYLFNYYGIVNVVSLAPFDELTSVMYMAALASFIILIPYLVIILYKYTKIKMLKVFTILMFSLILSYLGLLFGVFIVSKFMLQVSISYSFVPAVWSIKSVLKNVMTFGTIFSIIPQLIWVFPILVKGGVIKLDMISKARPYYLVGSIIVGAAITPQDLISAIVVAVAIVIPLEIGYLIAIKLNGRLKNV